jgi:hypothetical protein
MWHPNFSKLFQTAKYTNHLVFTAGAINGIKREGGVERQHELHCTACLVQLSYSDQPKGTERKRLYFIPGATRARLTDQDKWWQEETLAMEQKKREKEEEDEDQQKEIEGGAGESFSKQGFFATKRGSERLEQG